MRRSIPLTFLSLSLFAAAAASSLGATGCFAQCDALCLGDVSASGPFVAVDPARPLQLRFCVDGDCTVCAVEPGSVGIGCDDISGAIRADGALELRRYLDTSPYRGSLVEVEVVATDTGEVLLSATMAVTSLREDELCGTICHDATVTWDDSALGAASAEPTDG